MPNTLAHHLLTDAQPTAPSNQLPPVYIPGMKFYGMEHLFGHFGSAVQLCSLPSYAPAQWQSMGT